jgi:hypothetical protein
VLIGEAGDILLPDLRGACEAVDLGVLVGQQKGRTRDRSRMESINNM